MSRSLLSRRSETALLPMIRPVIRHLTGVLLLSACCALPGCGGSPGGQAPNPGNSGSPGPAPSGDAGVSWGFFNYTPDFVGGLNNARVGRGTGYVWTEIERTPGSGSYDWTELDLRVRNAQSASMNAIVVLKTGNGAAFSEAECFRRVEAAGDAVFEDGRVLASCPLRPDMESAWGRMVTQLVERYDGDGQADMPGLTRSIRVDLQIENEAANWEHWDYGEGDRTASADDYLRLLEISYQAKQAANPATQIILTALIYPHLLARCDGRPNGPGCGAPIAQPNLTFTKRILTRPAVFDAVDVHFFVYYRFDPPYVDEGYQWVASQMQQRGYQRPIQSLEWTGAMMLHVTAEGHAAEFSQYFPYSREFASPAAFQAMYRDLDHPSNVVYREWFESEQAVEFVKIFTNLLALGASRLVHVQYADFRPGTWDNVWWNWQGIVKYVGGAVRKPSYYTYNRLAERISGFTSARRVGPAGEVRLYEFTVPGRQPTYVLWTDGPNVTVDLSRVISRRSVRVTSIVTELDGRNDPVVPADQTFATTAVPARDVPVLLSGTD